jgi:hypothetical protein
MPRDYSEIEVIRAALDAFADDFMISIPGTVVAYYPHGATGTGTASADVRPAVKRPLRGIRTGRTVYRELPTFPDVPIAWPSGGGYFEAFPLAPGDPVALHFSSLAFGEYLTTGELSEPADVRRHSIGYPFAVPGACRPDPQAIQDAPTDGVVIGKDGANQQIKIDATSITLGKGATDYVALASLVKAAIDTIQNKYDAHTHPAPGGATSAPVAASLIGSLGDVKATITKAK